MNTLKKYPLFGKVALNSFVSSLGDSMYYVALLTYAASMERADLAIMIVSLSESLPYFFNIFLGSLADMSHHKAQKLINMSLLRVVCYLVVGLLIGFKTSLTLLIGIACLNFISDLFGKYAGGLWSPFFSVIVEKEDIEEAQGFSSGINQLIAIMAQFIGAFLLGLFSYRLLAFINSATFLVGALILISVKKELTQVEETFLNQSRANISLKNMWQQIKDSLKDLIAYQELFRLLGLFAGVNGLLATVVPLVSLYFSQNPENVWVNFSFSIAILTGCSSVGVVLGSLFGSKYFKNKELLWCCKGLFLMTIGVSLAVILKQTAVIFLLSMGWGTLAGIASPKLGAMILSKIAVDKLGSVNGAINTVLMCIPPVTTSLLTMTASILGLNYAMMLLASLSLVGLIVALVIKKNA